MRFEKSLRYICYNSHIYIFVDFQLRPALSPSFLRMKGGCWHPPILYVKMAVLSLSEEKILCKSASEAAVNNTHSRGYGYQSTNSDVQEITHF